MKQKLTWDEIAGYGFYLISLIMLFVSVYLCFSTDIWYDELFTLGFSNESQGNLVSMTARDVHPPFYYLIVKAALVLSKTGINNPGIQVPLAKLVSCFAFFLLSLFSITKIKKHFGTFSAGLFSLLIVSMPRLSDYIVEIRMYGVAMLLITIGMVLTYEIIQEHDKYSFVVLTLVSILACYTHYYAAVSAVMIYVFLFLELIRRKKLKQYILRFLLSGFACMVSYLPWILGAVMNQTKQVKDQYWIGQVSLRTIGGCIKYLFMPDFVNQKLNLGFTFVLVMMFGYVVFRNLCFIGKAKESERNQIIFAFGGLLNLAGLVAFGFIVSLCMKPIFVYRYMLPSMGVFWLSFTILLANIIKKRAEKISIEKGILILISALLLIVGIRDFRAFYGNEMWKRLQMDQTLKAFSEIEEGDILLFNFGQLQGVTALYLPNDSYLWYESTEQLIEEMFPMAHTLVNEEFSDEAGMVQINKLLSTGENVWFFGSGNAREEIVEKWKEAGIYSEDMGDYMLERYWFKLYKIDGNAKER